MRYPKYVYSINETTTENNMREYDRKKEMFYAKCEELNPDYWKLNLRERMTIGERAEKELGFGLS